MVRISTDLPVPEPPTTPITSPRRMSRSSPSCSTCSPKRFTRPRTSITLAGVSGAAMSDAQDREQDGEQSIGDDDQEDAFHDRAGGHLADAFRAAGDAQAFETADQRDQDGEDRRLHHAD